MQVQSLRDIPLEVEGHVRSVLIFDRDVLHGHGGRSGGSVQRVPIVQLTDCNSMSGEVEYVQNDHCWFLYVQVRNAPSN